MMSANLKTFFCALIALLVSIQSSHASTIIKLNLGGVGPDIALGPAGGQPPGILGTVNDGIAATAGDQNTAIEFTSFLDFIPDINTSDASFTLSGLQEAGPAGVLFGNVVGQNFNGGIFSLYDTANNLLLQAPVISSVVSGVLGPPGTGGLFETTLSTPTGGSLANQIQNGTVSLSIQLGNINGGNGLLIGGGGQVAPFLADATGSIAADFSGIPEPASMMLTLIGSAMFVLRRRRS